MQTLDHTSEIYNQLKLGRDANCSEKLAKVYLSKNGYYLNPFLEDFKQANKLAGVNESKNLDDVVEDLTTFEEEAKTQYIKTCLLYTSPSPRDGLLSRMPSSA